MTSRLFHDSRVFNKPHCILLLLLCTHSLSSRGANSTVFPNGIFLFEFKAPLDRHGSSRLTLCSRFRSFCSGPSWENRHIATLETADSSMSSEIVLPDRTGQQFCRELSCLCDAYPVSFEILYCNNNIQRIEKEKNLLSPQLHGDVDASSELVLQPVESTTPPQREGCFFFNFFIAIYIVRGWAAMKGCFSPFDSCVHVEEFKKQKTASSEIVLPDPGFSSDAASLLYNMSDTKV
jgi:hypothetical protein